MALNVLLHNFINPNVHRTFYVCKALLFHYQLPPSFWSYVVSHATHIINTISIPLLHNKSPYQLLYDNIPDLHTLKVLVLHVILQLLLHIEQIFNLELENVYFLVTSLASKTLFFLTFTLERFLSKKMLLFMITLVQQVTQTRLNTSTTMFAIMQDLEHSRQAILACILWHVWKQRNTVFWQNETLTRATVFKRGLNLLVSWQNA